MVMHELIYNCFVHYVNGLVLDIVIYVINVKLDADADPILQSLCYEAYVVSSLITFFISSSATWPVFSFYFFNYLTGSGSQSAFMTQTGNTSLRELGGSLKV